MPRYILSLEVAVRCTVPYGVTARTAADAKAIARDWAKTAIEKDGVSPVVRVVHCEKVEE